MAVFIRKFKLAYFPVPKIACSSLKHLFFYLENEFWYKGYRANGRRFDIHARTYPSIEFDSAIIDRFRDFERIAVVRDPVKRFLSAYSNRVVHYKELATNRLRANQAPADLTPNPELPEFIDRLEDYRKVSPSIRHHTEPTVFYLGSDLDVFTKVFKIEEMQALGHFLSTCVGSEVEIPHRQTDGPKIDVSDLGSAHLDRVRQFYAEDYKLLDSYYD